MQIRTNTYDAFYICSNSGGFPGPVQQPEICNPERQILQSQCKEQYKQFVISFHSDNSTPCFSDLEQMLQIRRAQIDNCLSGKTDDAMGLQHRYTIRRQRKANATTDYFQKAWAQTVKLLSTGKAESPTFCMTMLGIFFSFWKKKILIYMSS